MGRDWWYLQDTIMPLYQSTLRTQKEMLNTSQTDQPPNRHSVNQSLHLSGRPTQWWTTGPPTVMDPCWFRIDWPPLHCRIHELSVQGIYQTLLILMQLNYVSAYIRFMHNRYKNVSGNNSSQYFNRDFSPSDVSICFILPISPTYIICTS